MSAGSQRVAFNSGTGRAWITQRRVLRESPALLSFHPLLAPASLKAHGLCSPSSFQATDEDSPPNNQITYSIVNASAFGSYFDISVYEGYGGTCGSEGPAGEEGRQVGIGLHFTPVSGGGPSASQTPWATWGAAPQLLSAGAACGVGSPFHRLKICVSDQSYL